MSGRRLFTFDTTHSALWAEEVANESAIPVEVVPAPPGTTARCNLALDVLPEDFDRLAGYLEEAGVQFGVHGAGV